MAERESEMTSVQGGVIVTLPSYVAICNRCGRLVSVVPRRTQQEAESDLSAHVNIQHDPAEGVDDDDDRKPVDSPNEGNRHD